MAPLGLLHTLIAASADPALPSLRTSADHVMHEINKRQNVIHVAALRGLRQKLEMKVIMRINFNPSDKRVRILSLSDANVGLTTKFVKKHKALLYLRPQMTACLLRKLWSTFFNKLNHI